MTIHMTQPSLRLVCAPWTECLLDALSTVAAPAQQASPQWRLECSGAEVRLHTTGPPSVKADRELVAAVPDLVGRLLGAAWAATSNEESDLAVDLDLLGVLTGLYHAGVHGPWTLTTPEECDWEWRVLDGQREVLAGPYDYDGLDDTLVGYHVPDNPTDPRTTPFLELLPVARDAIPDLAAALTQVVVRHQPDTTRIRESVALLREDGDINQAEAVAADIGYWDTDVTDPEDIAATTCTVCDTAWPCPMLTHIHRHISADEGGLQWRR